MGRPRKHPSPLAVVEAQTALLERVGIDRETALYSCWACRLPLGGIMQIAHIQAVRNDGDDAPSNFFLLCATCHFAQPDDAPREIQELWLKLRMRWEDRIRAELEAARRQGTLDEYAAWLEWMDRSGDERRARRRARGDTT